MTKNNENKTQTISDPKPKNTQPNIKPKAQKVKKSNQKVAIEDQGKEKVGDDLDKTLEAETVDKNNQKNNQKIDDVAEQKTQEIKLREPEILLNQTQYHLSRLEEIFQAPVLSYFKPANGNIWSEDLYAILECLKSIGKVDKLILFIRSNGGSGMVSLRIVHLLRSFAKKLIILAPSECASAATMLALGCDEIYMGPLSSLSPVDSSLVHALSPVDKSGKSVSISMDELLRVGKLWYQSDAQNLTNLQSLTQSNQDRCTSDQQSSYQSSDYNSNYDSNYNPNYSGANSYQNGHWDGAQNIYKSQTQEQSVREVEQTFDQLPNDQIQIANTKNGDFESTASENFTSSELRQNSSENTKLGISPLWQKQKERLLGKKDQSNSHTASQNGLDKDYVKDEYSNGQIANQKKYYYDSSQALDQNSNQIGARYIQENPYKYLYNYVHPLVFGAVDRHSSLSVRICKEILSYHISDQVLIEKITSTLNHDYPAHGYPITNIQAKNLGLPICEITEEMQHEINELQLLYGEMTQEMITDYDRSSYHDAGIYSIVESKNIQIYYQHKFDRFYRENEKRYFTMNDKTAWNKATFADLEEGYGKDSVDILSDEIDSNVTQKPTTKKPTKAKAASENDNTPKTISETKTSVRNLNRPIKIQRIHF